MKTFIAIATLCCLMAFTAVQAADFSYRTYPKDRGLAILPPGDPLLTGDCTDYVDLSGMALPINVAGSTAGATNNYGPYPSCPPCFRGDWYALSSSGPDRTYKWTVPADGQYTLSLSGSSYDTGLEIYNFTCPTEPSYPGDFICGSDDACTIASELFCMSFTAGQELLIVVDGYGGNAGAYQLHITAYQPAADLDVYIASTMQTHHVAGLSACAIRDGQILWTGNYGHANIAQDIAPTDSTLFYLASISKTVVAVALMQLWEDGLFGLDDNINLYLPWSIRHPVFPVVPITFRMLMTHRSGIIDNWNVLTPLETFGSDSPIQLGDFLRGYLTPGGAYYNATLNFGNYAPGTVWNYSNVGAGLAGYLVERINPGHLSFEDYCQQYIFAPLEMDNSSFFLANLNVNDIAVPYAWNGSTYVPYQHLGVPEYPAAQLRTSVNQLARHLIAFMQHGQIDGTRILDSNTVEFMSTPQLPNPFWGGHNMGMLWASRPWWGRVIWGHGGSYYGARTEMFYDPEENTGAIVLTNGEDTWAPRYILHELFEYAGSVVAPAAPQALVILIAGEEAQLYWQPSENASIYHVYGTSTGDGAADLLASVNDTTWSDLDFATRPLTFFYYVTAE